MPAKKSAKRKAQTAKRTKTLVSTPSQPPLKNILLGLGALALLGGGIYSYNIYKNSEIETSGVVVCNEAGVCEKSMHIHAEIDITVCGKKFYLPKDVGNLADTHTHKEDNLLHWHDKVRIDRDGNTAGGEEDRKISSVIDLYLKDQLPEKCSGSAKAGTFGLTVNNTVSEDIMNYVWKDGDKLKLTFQ